MSKKSKISCNTRSLVGSHMLKWVSGGYLDFTTKNYTNWFKARSKWNFMLTLEIELDQKQKLEQKKNMFISTLHMPCAFKELDQSIMITSAALALEHIQKISGTNPYVLAGDFNIRPGTNLYDIITTGIYQGDHIINDYPPEDTWRPNNIGLKPMRSALKELYGVEPKWTNYCINSRFENAEPFKDTLDYILISDQFKVINAFCKADTDIICPNDKESSDHVLIWSDLELIN